MASIVTLTVNPTIDKNTRVEQVRAEEKLRCERPRREPGGGGLNVSRAVLSLGGESTAYYLGGGPTGKMLEGLLDDEGLHQVRLAIDDWTRENLMVLEDCSGDQYRFGMPGPEVSEAEWKGCLEKMENLDSAPEYLVASGSLAPTMPDDFYARLAQVARKLDARFIVDTSGTPLRKAVEEGAFLIKPNVAEFEDIVGEELTDEDQQVRAATELIDRGCCKVMVISLGSGGALVVTSDGAEHLRTPTVPIRSKVGAGDSMVGGMTLGLVRELELLDAVRYGVCAGAAAVMTEGTELCRREDTERLFEKMKS